MTWVLMEACHVSHEKTDMTYRDADARFSRDHEAKIKLYETSKGEEAKLKTVEAVLRAFERAVLAVAESGASGVTDETDATDADADAKTQGVCVTCHDPHDVIKILTLVPCGHCCPVLFQVQDERVSRVPCTRGQCHELVQT